tara:strand:- start:1107 stop:2846 length:1740 start_codon:yes stop_codon:yes gene_type:complete
LAEQKISLAVNLKDKASSGLESLKSKLGGFATGANLAAVAVLALVVGLGKLAFSAAKMGDDFAKTATQVGTTASALSELTFAAQIGGAGMAEVATTLRVVSKRVNDANNGLETSVRSFKQAGIAVRKTNGQLKTAEELIMDSADAFKALKSPVERTALAQELFGRSGTKLIPTLLLGRQGIMELREEAVLLGLTFTQLEAEQAELFQDELLRLMSTFKGLALTIGKQLVPMLTTLFTFLKDVMLVVVPAVNFVFQALLGTVKALLEPISALATAFTILGSVTWTGLKDMTDGIRNFFNKDLSDEELKKKEEQLKRFHNMLGVTGEKTKLSPLLMPKLDAEEARKPKEEEDPNALLDNLEQVKEGFLNAHTAYSQTLTEMSMELGTNIHATLATTIDNIGTAFGEMLTEGKSFKESMSAIWKDLKKQVIMQISQMMVKMLAMYALKLLLGGGSGGMFSSAGNILGASAANGGVFNALDVPSFAQGGITNAPQLALIGDNANNREAVVPLPNGRSIPVEMNGGGMQSIGQLNILPNASIDEALMNQPMSYWEDLVQEKILPAINNLGSQGETITTEFRSQR